MTCYHYSKQIELIVETSIQTHHFSPVIYEFKKRPHCPGKKMSKSCKQTTKSYFLTTNRVTKKISRWKKIYYLRAATLTRLLVSSCKHLSKSACNSVKCGLKVLPIVSVNELKRINATLYHQKQTNAFVSP